MSLCIFQMLGQGPCLQGNTAFSAGEKLHYVVAYNWGAIWLQSAEGTFTVRHQEVKGRPGYLLSGSGFTYSKYDWFYKVRDEFETELDSSSFRPLRFHASIHEGGKHEKHDYFFNNINHKIYTSIQRGKSSAKVDSTAIAPCTVDVLTAIYFARNLDYSHCKVNDTLSISLFLDNKLYPIFVRYQGRTIYTSDKLGAKFNCIRFSPLLVEGTIFKGGEGMSVWVTDDQNRVPVYIETPLVIGTVKVQLADYSGLRHPEDARIK
jgi:hypothetical protein